VRVYQTVARDEKVVCSDQFSDCSLFMDR